MRARSLRRIPTSADHPSTPKRFSGAQREASNASARTSPVSAMSALDGRYFWCDAQSVRTGPS